jgi:hypothetical protein
MHTWIRPALLVFLCLTMAFGLTGCVNLYHVGVGAQTPPNIGKIKYYSTDNVPFEYEELGHISMMLIGSCFGPQPLEMILRNFNSEVAKDGADAVLNFQIDYAFSSSWLIFPGAWNTQVSGTAVKIKRP